MKCSDCAKFVRTSPVPQYDHTRDGRCAALVPRAALMSMDEDDIDEHGRPMMNGQIEFEACACFESGAEIEED